MDLTPRLPSVSYLRIEAYLTDVAGNDWSLRFHHRWAEGVRHHGLLDGVHLRRNDREEESVAADLSG